MIGIVFPGQGSQHTGMGKALYDLFPYVRLGFSEAEDVLHTHIAKTVFGHDEAALKATETAQPAIFLTSWALVEVLRTEWDWMPEQHASWMAGHSLGEYTALWASGALTFSQTLAVIQHRIQAMNQAPQGSMMAILGMTRNQVQGVLESPTGGLQHVQNQVFMANDNGPQQVILSGSAPGLEQAALVFKNQGAKVIALNVSGPFHCPMMQKPHEIFHNFLKDLVLQDPRVSVITNTKSQLCRNHSDLSESLAMHMISPVLWTDSMTLGASLGVTSIVEMGPGKVLTGMNKKIVPQNVETLALSDWESLKTWVQQHVVPATYHSGPKHCMAG